MKKLRCRVTTLLAVAIAGYSGGAVAQQACENEIRQLRSENQQRQVNEREKQQVTEMLDSAERVDARSCQQFVARVRQQLQQTGGQNQDQQSTSRAQPPSQRPQPTGQQRPPQAEQQRPPQAEQQRPPQAEQQRPQEQAQQRPSDTTTEVQIQQAPANVEVDAGPPQVIVRQQPPKVTVEQQPPLVEIIQPKAEVRVTQAEPKVTVNQGDPQVRIQQAEPQIQVLQAGEPEVRMLSPEAAADRGASPQQERGTSQVQQDSAAAAGQAGQQSTGRGAASAQVGATRDASQLVGRSVLSRDGEQVGEISEIVRSRTDNELHAIVDVGGFFGIGERPVALPIERGEIDRDGNVRLPLSREQLEQMEEYEPQQYQR